MNELRALALARLIRESHQHLIGRVRSGEVLSAGDLEQNARRIADLVDRLSSRDETIEECADMLAHRINNLLMAVQMAHDLLSLSQGDADASDRIRKRLRDTIEMTKGTLEQVREILMGLP